MMNTRYSMPQVASAQNRPMKQNHPLEELTAKEIQSPPLAFAARRQGFKSQVNGEEHALIKQAYSDEPRAGYRENCFSEVRFFSQVAPDVITFLADPRNTTAFVITKAGQRDGVKQYNSLIRSNLKNNYADEKITIDADIDSRTIQNQANETLQILRLRYKTPTQNTQPGSKLHRLIQSAFPDDAQIPAAVCFKEPWFSLGNHYAFSMALRYLKENSGSVYLLVNRREAQRMMEASEDPAQKSERSDGVNADVKMADAGWNKVAVRLTKPESPSRRRGRMG